MSEVISFRLDKNNPREARALKIMQARRAQGYAVRDTITDALLQLDHQSEIENRLEIETLYQSLRRLEQLLEQMQNGEFGPSRSGDGDHQQAVLTDVFVASVKQGARPGLRLD